MGCVRWVGACVDELAEIYIYKASSSARLATPEVADRPFCNSVESAYWSGDFLKRFFLFDPSLTCGLMIGCTSNNLLVTLMFHSPCKMSSR